MKRFILNKGDFKIKNKNRNMINKLKIINYHKIMNKIIMEYKEIIEDEIMNTSPIKYTDEYINILRNNIFKRLLNENITSKYVYTEVNLIRSNKSKTTIKIKGDIFKQIFKV